MAAGFRKQRGSDSKRDQRRWRADNYGRRLKSLIAPECTEYERREIARRSPSGVRRRGASARAGGSVPSGNRPSE